MNAPKVGEIVGCGVERIGPTGCLHISDGVGGTVIVHPRGTHPLPPSLSDEAQAVLDAAVARLQAACSGTVEDLRIATITLSAVTDTYIASTLPPPKPVDPIAIMERALKRVENINNGPDKASGEYRCTEAAAIAREALAAVASARMGDGA